MIPTTATSSPSTATISSSNNIINGQQNSSSAMIGIASLILEGRAIDEYQKHAPPRTVADALVSDGASGSALHGSATAAASGSGGAGRQSPQPSTSRAATSASTSGHVINITTNPHAFGFATTPLLIDPYNSSSASSSAESTHQRWTQKLCQLRQASPAGCHSPAYEQKIAIQTQSSTGEPELVALAINESSSDRGDFEILRRVMLNRANVPSGNATAGSASSSPGSGSENFLHSLQSLATTCLRGGSPSSVESGYRYSALSTPPLAPPVIATATPKYNYRATPPRFQSPYVMDVPGSASSSGSGIQSPRLAWSPALNVGAETSSSSAREKYLKQTSSRIQIPATITSLSNTASSSATSITPTTTPTTKDGATAAAAASAYPHQGPHCDQFLRKMGLAKGEAAETEDHFCDMSYVNITCSRWRAYCLKMEAIIARGEPMCIEVYLGPVAHKILLEQWIITQKEKVPPPTMTLSSLCSAIRSQLYFSQISAWCDLIKKSDTTIYDTGRIIIPTATGAAGDLATPATAVSSPNANANNVTPGSSPSTTSSSPINQLTNAMLLNRRPRLNIFYRIKQYDSTASFNSKPNVHNFPNVNISENFSISVCLKSLPRMNGGIPKIGTAVPTTAAEVGATNAANATNKRAAATTTATSSHTIAPSPSLPISQRTETPRTSRPLAVAPAALNCDNNNKNGRTISASSASSPLSTVIHTASYGNGKHKATTFFIDEEELLDEIDAGEDDGNASDFANGAGDSSNSSFSSNANLSHRERQLLKYRKRMERRDKKHRKPLLGSGEVHANGGATSCQPMEQGDEEVQLHQGPSITAPTSHIEMISTGTQTQMTCCQQCGSEKTLVCLNCTGCHGSSSIELDEMDSSSSLSSSDIIHTPRNKAELLLAAIQRTPKAAKHKKQTMRSTVTAVGTASTQHHLQQNNNHLNAPAPGVNASARSCQVCKRQKTQHNFSGRSFEPGEESTELISVEDEENGDGKGSNIVGDECDRSTYTVAENDPSHIMDEESFISSTKLTPHIDRCTISTISTSPPAIQERAGGEDRSSTPPMSIHSATECATSQFKTPSNQPQQQQQLFQQKHTPKPPNLLHLSCNYHSVAGGDGLGAPTTCRLATHANGTTTLIYEGTASPNPQNPIYMRKGLPKVNLTPIFCSPSSTITASLSAPIPIENCRSTSEANFSFDQTTISRSVRHGLNIPAIDNNIPVQKSYSAPTLPNSPSLSPRFAKQAAIYKRRSRHLSDRSDRSSLGSDEQFSDEDLENGMYSPAATSPMKQRSQRTSAVFGRLPLLGNLEESLLQKRLLPKIEVMGFKVLLGASGGFCPTQLTIPAASYFYELHGEALSTPYVCEIRLPRKGYSVPRAGTVQATLLNPMGTVVRMFVVSYDMRDMPPLHQTFIRQRILAEASSNETVTLQNNNTANSSFANGFGSASENGNNNPTNNNNNNNNNKYRLSPSGGLHGESNLGHFISAEHMKRLRYSIHLRFQTSRSGRLSLHTDIRLLISRRTDCDTAAAHAKGVLEAPNDLVTDTVMPTNPKYSARQEPPNKI